MVNVKSLENISVFEIDLYVTADSVCVTQRLSHFFAIYVGTDSDVGLVYF